MTFDPHNTASIPLGTEVIGDDGRSLGHVHEVQPHYLLVGEDGQHEDLSVPVHAIVGFSEGQLRVSVTRELSTLVDPVETARTRIEGEHPEH